MHKCTDGRVDGFRKILGNRPKPNLVGGPRKDAEDVSLP